MSIEVDVYAGRNWLITPAALAVDEVPPSTISDQTWLVVLTGVAIVDIQGDNPHDWRRETLWFPPDPILKGALNDAISRYSIPLPTGRPFFPFLSVDQWAPFATVSSIFAGPESGFAVDTWRPSPLINPIDFNGNNIPNVFNGIEVDVAVRNTSSVLHRVSYHVTLRGRIIFVP